jgi:hypothetical protein
MKILSTMILIAALAAVSIAPAPAQDGGFGMGPPTPPEMVAAANAAVAKPMAPGPFAPTWDSVKENYHAPKWFQDAKFGLFMHWGLYSVPAYHNEWYEKHMYAAFAQWHVEHFGPQDKFGYKDFIPLFTCEKFNADEWADLFQKSGAKYVVPTAEQAVITSLASTNAGVGKIQRVELLGHPGELAFSQDETGLKIKLPAKKLCDFAYAFKITNTQ